VPGDDEPEQAEQPEQGWARYEPRGNPLPEPARTPATPPPRAGTGRTGALVAAVLVALLVGTAAVVLALGGGAVTATDDTSRSASTGPSPAGRPATGTAVPRVHTAEGLRDLTAAIGDATGDTLVFRAVLYPEYASVEVPEDADSRRQRRLFWDGALRDDDLLGTSSYDRVDLADLSAPVLQRLLQRAASRVDEPTTTYVIVEGASRTFGTGARVLAYASNAYSEGAYVEADLAGTVVRVVDY
jgi:hypothetical protein